MLVILNNNKQIVYGALRSARPGGRVARPQASARPTTSPNRLYKRKQLAQNNALFNTFCFSFYTKIIHTYIFSKTTHANKVLAGNTIFIFGVILVFQMLIEVEIDVGIKFSVFLYCKIPTYLPRCIECSVKISIFKSFATNRYNRRQLSFRFETERE